MTVGQFAEAVAYYCGMTGGSVTSWGRTELRNAVVGGVEFSAHRFFRGADIVYDADLEPARVEVARAKIGPTLQVMKKPEPVDRIELAERCGLWLLVEDDHDHVQPAGWQRG